MKLFGRELVFRYKADFLIYSSFIADSCKNVLTLLDSEYIMSKSAKVGK